MAKRALTKQQVRDGLQDLKLVMRDPYGDEANKVLDTIVTGYNRMVYTLGIAHDLTLLPGWAAWHRLLQVRFVGMVCRDKPAVAEVIRECISNGQPSIDLLIREVVRQYILELIEWAEVQKLGSRVEAPKRPDQYWQQAFDSLKADFERKGETFRDASPEEYAIFGANYSV